MYSTAVFVNRALDCITLHYIHKTHSEYHIIYLHPSGCSLIALHCTALHSITSQYIAFHCIALHYTTLHCVTLHYIHNTHDTQGEWFLLHVRVDMRQPGRR